LSEVHQRAFRFFNSRQNGSLVKASEASVRASAALMRARTRPKSSAAHVIAAEIPCVCAVLSQAGEMFPLATTLPIKVTRGTSLPSRCRCRCRRSREVNVGGHEYPDDGATSSPDRREAMLGFLTAKFGRGRSGVRAVGCCPNQHGDA